MYEKLKSNELSLTSWQCLSNERVLDREANVEGERERESEETQSVWAVTGSD